jgi:hypothetical protein
VSGTTIGVLGATWRATVTPWGDVLPWGPNDAADDGPAPLRWYIAADDRWHVPEHESAVRQTRIDGAPVVETRVRIPSGDAVHRVWATGDGITVVEIENDSAMPIAVAVTRRDVLTSRPPADVPIEGIELPAESIVLPVGHRSSVRVGLAHDGRGAGTLPDDLAPALQVARGWTTIAERAGRVVLPDAAWADSVTAARCDVALVGPVDPGEDPVAFLLGVGEMVRMGDAAEPWVIDVVEAAETVMRRHRKADGLPWDVRAALGSAARVMARAGENRGVDDIEAVLARAPGITTVDLAPPQGIRVVPWVEQHLARPLPGAACALLPGGFPTTWFGAAVEAYRLPAGPRHAVSYAIRWHGERPAVLWEVEGPAGDGDVGAPGVRLTGGGVDPAWQTDQATGEALWASPPGAADAIAAAAIAAAAAQTDEPTEAGPSTPAVDPLGIDPSDGISFS